MSTQKPVILIVHGSWHEPAHFDVQLQALRDAGYTAHCPQLPSFGAAPEIGLADDAARVRQELERILTPDAQGDVPDVLVYAHSYGGVVTTDAVWPKYSKRNRTLIGKKGGVIRLIYACAFLLVPGQTLVDAFQGNGLLPPFIECDPGAMCIMPEDFRRNAFYHDLTPAQQDKYLGLNKKSPAITNLSTTTHAPYLYIPTTYLYCTEDRALPLRVQQWMVANAEILGVKFDIAECDASHSPYISQPQVLIKLLHDLPSAASEDLSRKHQEQAAELGAFLQRLMASMPAI